MDPKAFDEAELLLQAEGTPAKRLQEAIGAFEGLAKKGDEDAAADILARMEGKLKNGDKMTPEIRKSLDTNKIGIISHGISRIRRGSRWDLVFTAIAAGLGYTLGYQSHKILDWRPGGFPIVHAVASVAGVGLGVTLDTTLTNRNLMFTGGSMFGFGSAVYSLTHPKDAAPAEPAQPLP
ncbi:MAG: hypothetical protein KC468_25660 [Myxococcales bacterium]|nr:hypothetical protein [Myxococcales bacterium]